MYDIVVLAGIGNIEIDLDVTTRSELQTSLWITASTSRQFSLR